MEVQRIEADSYIDTQELNRISEILDIPMGNSINSFIGHVIDYILTGPRVSGRIKKIYTGEYAPSKIGANSMNCLSAMNASRVMSLFLARLRRGMDPSAPRSYYYCDIPVQEGIITLTYENSSHAEQAYNMIMGNRGDYPSIFEAQRMVDRSVAHDDVKRLMSSILLRGREENILDI